MPAHIVAYTLAGLALLEAVAIGVLWRQLSHSKAQI